MLAYHDDPKIKEGILARLTEHREADEIVKGKYWEGGKGCAVGCTIHSGNHIEYENRFGIPVMLAHLEDMIFEGLPNGVAKAWPERFMSAINVGADLSLVGWKFLHWLLTDEKVNPGINHPLVRDAVRACADVLAALANGKPVDASAARRAANAAESAASAARSAAWSAARSAKSAESAARSAASAAWSAAWSAESAARSAASAAWSAASAESAAWSAKSAERAAYMLMADKLIELIETA